MIAGLCLFVLWKILFFLIQSGIPLPFILGDSPGGTVVDRNPF